MNPVVVHALQAYYSYFMDASRIKTSYEVNSEHCLPTLDYGEDCDVLSTPYLGNCKYDGAGAALTQLYGELNPRTVITDSSRLFKFDQTSYIPSSFSSIGQMGYIYVPKSCEDGVSIFLCVLLCYIFCSLLQHPLQRHKHAILVLF